MKKNYTVRVTFANDSHLKYATLRPAQPYEHRNEFYKHIRPRVQNPLHLRWSACFIAPLFVTGNKARVHNECITKEPAFFFIVDGGGIRVAFFSNHEKLGYIYLSISLTGNRFTSYGKRGIVKGKSIEGGERHREEIDVKISTLRETFQRINLKGYKDSGEKRMKIVVERCYIQHQFNRNDTMRLPSHS